MKNDVRRPHLEIHHCYTVCSVHKMLLITLQRSHLDGYHTVYFLLNLKENLITRII
jgi:hypothetical protein